MENERETEVMGQEEGGSLAPLLQEQVYTSQQSLARYEMSYSELCSAYGPSSFSAQRVKDLEDFLQKLKDERDQANATFDEYKVYKNILEEEVAKEEITLPRALQDGKQCYMEGHQLRGETKC